MKADSYRQPSTLADGRICACRRCLMQADPRLTLAWSAPGRHGCAEGVNDRSADLCDRSFSGLCLRSIRSQAQHSSCRGAATSRKLDIGLAYLGVPFRKGERSSVKADIA